MLVIPYSVYENLDIIHTMVAVHIHVVEELPGDLHGLGIPRRPSYGELGDGHTTVVLWKKMVDSFKFNFFFKI